MKNALIRTRNFARDRGFESKPYTRATLKSSTSLTVFLDPDTKTAGLPTNINASAQISLAECSHLGQLRPSGNVGSEPTRMRNTTGQAKPISGVQPAMKGKQTLRRRTFNSS